MKWLLKYSFPEWLHSLRHQIEQILRPERIQSLCQATSATAPLIADKCLWMASESDSESGNTPLFPLFSAKPGSGSKTDCPLGLRKSKAEKIAEREQQFLDIAHELLNRDGFADFSMDKLVRASGYSKGTLYNHFSSKEDCLSAMCLRGLAMMEDMFSRAAAFDGTLREKILAMNVAYHLYASLQPTLSLTVLSAKTPSFTEKTSAARSQLIDECDLRITLMVDDIYRRAIEQGDLPDNPGLTVELMGFISWSQAFGLNALMTAACDITAVSRTSGTNVALISSNILLDGMGFKPLSSEWDYQASWKKIESDIFAAEMAQLAASK
ncbi:MAG: TetR family transcriptional regulator [Thalassobium sp.]|nr:MAG: TetR family transcriptional regulator [Thalassobium sp.]